MPAFPSYTDLSKSTGPNPGGTAQTFYWSPLSAMTTCQQPTIWSTATTPQQIAEITTAHVFATGKMLQKIYCTQNMGELEFSEASDIDANGGFCKGKLFLPGVEAANFGNLVQMKGEDIMFLIPTSDGKYFQVGTTLFPAKLMGVKFGVAKQGTGVRGTEIEFQAFQLSPMIYNSTLQLTPAP